MTGVQTCALPILDTGGDIVMVQEVLGHDDPSITRRYIGIDQQKKEKAINNLRF